MMETETKSEEEIKKFREIFGKVVQGKNLNFEEARFCADLIISGKAPQNLVAGLLVALRMKGETSEEIAGFAHEMRQKAVKPKISDENIKPIDTCGTGGDGLHTFNASTASAIILAAEGIKVAKHGNRAVSSKLGSADILEKLGVKINVEPEEVERELKEKNFVFLFAPKFHPAMKNVAPIRKELGIRTIFNLLGPITNPVGVKRQIIGVFSPDFAEKIAQALSLLGTEKTLVFSGETEEGFFIDEISPSGRTFFFKLENGKIEKFELDAREILGKKHKLEELKQSESKPEIEFLNVLEGKEREALLDFIALNVAAGFIICDRVKDFKEGYIMAKDIIKSGKAKKFLQEHLV
jgi:anthranilate phosphoribosyltransferase